MAMYELLFIQEEGGSVDFDAVFDRTITEMIPIADALKARKKCFAVMVSKQGTSRRRAFDYANSDSGPGAGKVLPKHQKTAIELTPSQAAKLSQGSPQLF